MNFTFKQNYFLCSNYVIYGMHKRLKLFTLFYKIVFYIIRVFLVMTKKLMLQT